MSTNSSVPGGAGGGAQQNGNVLAPGGGGSTINELTSTLMAACQAGKVQYCAVAILSSSFHRFRAPLCFLSRTNLLTN